MWRHRRAVCGGATGATLEIGVGTGFSFPYYRIEHLVACDPNMHMLRIARRRARTTGREVVLVAARAEALPFRDGAFDTVTSCLTFCTVDDRNGATSEIERVLDAGGQFRFAEHGRSERRGFAAIQRLLTPGWRRLFGGCRLDREPAPPLGSLDLAKLRRCSAGTVARGTARKITAAESSVVHEAESI